MLILKDINGSIGYGLQEEKPYVVGRVDADLCLADSSVSRNHARLIVQKKKLFLQDLGSSNGTTVNGIMLTAEQLFNIPLGSQIHFGNKSTFILQEEVMKFCFSSLGCAQVEELIQLAKFFSGEVTSHWSSSTTHLVVPKIVLTTKLACALICKQRIIDIPYLKAKKQQVQKMLPLHDDSTNLLSVHRGTMKELTDIDFTIDRTRLFSNKLFIFANTKQAEQALDVIKFAGGYVKHDLYGEITLLANGSYERILVQNDGVGEPSSTYVQMEKHYSRVHRRAITLMDIIMAAVTGRIETYLETSIHIRGRDQNQCLGAAIAINSQAQRARPAQLPHSPLAETPELDACSIRKRQAEDRPSPSPKRSNNAFHLSDVPMHDLPESMGDKDLSSSSTQSVNEATASIVTDLRVVTAVISRKSNPASPVEQGSSKVNLSRPNKLLRKCDERINTILKSEKGEPSTSVKISKVMRCTNTPGAINRWTRSAEQSLANTDGQHACMKGRFNLKRTKIAEKHCTKPGYINVRKDLMPTSLSGLDVLQTEEPIDRETEHITPSPRSNRLVQTSIPIHPLLNVALLHEPCVILNLPKYFKNAESAHKDTNEESSQSPVAKFWRCMNFDPSLMQIIKFEKQLLPVNSSKKTFRLASWV